MDKKAHVLSIGLKLWGRGVGGGDERDGLYVNSVLFTRER